LQNKLFIDTNILLDILDDTRSSHEISKNFIKNCILEDTELAISDDIITTVYYIAQKTIPREKLFDFVLFIIQNFTILTFEKDIIKEAVILCKKYPYFDFEDTLQALSAKKNTFNTIITNDKNFPKINYTTIKLPI
jgi:predicted nucleic acid-binding protein